MLEEPQLPPVAEMLRWIEDVVAQGIRRPGYPADRWAEDFVHRTFGSLGLEAVRFEPVESAYWMDHRGALTVAGDESTEDIDCFPVPLSEPTMVEGWARALGSGRSERSRGQDRALRAALRRAPGRVPGTPTTRGWSWSILVAGRVGRSGLGV